MDRLSDYDYHLPETLIAQTPLQDRASSRMLWLNRSTGQIDHRAFRDLPNILEPGDLLVFNDTRVSALRLRGVKTTGAQIEALLLKDLGHGAFEALLKPGRRLKPGARIEFGESLHATVTELSEDGIFRLQFNQTESLAEAGEIPLPPYITTHLDDPSRYQTVFARTDGSAAAPTAALHFTPELLEELTARGVAFASVTLDVGLDTFRPVQVEDLATHLMHGERCSVSQATADAVAACQGRIVAIGTTSVRTLESFAAGPRQIEPGDRPTTLFIRPGYRFKIVDGMLTNFHLPKTTMLVMLAAMTGREPLFTAYEAAIKDNYRFLSFGDCMLIL